MHTNGLIQSLSNPVDVCSCAMLYTIAIQLITRMAGRILHDDEKLVNTIQSLIKRFYEREQKIQNHCPILVKHLENSNWLMKAYVTLFFSLFFTPVISSAILSWYTDEFILFTPVYLPFTDPTTKFGYLLNSSIMAFMTITVCIILVTADLYYISFTYQTVPMADILILKLFEFGEDLKRRHQNKNIEALKVASQVIKSRQLRAKADRKKKEADINKQLVQLIKEFNEYNDLIAQTLIYMEFTVFVAMSSNAIAIAMGMIVAFFFSKIIGIAVIAIFFFQMLNPCMQGTLVLNQNKKLEDALWAFPWYELPKPQQKIYLQFIHLVQNARKLSINVIGDLNMGLFTNALQACYSYMMVIWNVMKV
jgi:hypothetical protein